MILMSSRITLYNNLRNVFFILCIAFLILSIIYGVRVHIVSIVQKHFGFEKRREIAKRQANGYTPGTTTAKMRVVQRNSGRTGARTSGSLDTRYIDVSQVKTGKIEKSRKLQQSKKMQQSQKLGQEETTLLQNMEGTVSLSQGEDTVVLGAGTQGNDTVVLGAELQGNDTVVLGVGTQGNDTVVLGAGVQGNDTVVLGVGVQQNGNTVSAEQVGTTVFTSDVAETTVLTPGMEINALTSDAVVEEENSSTVVLAPEQRVSIKKRNDIMVVHGDDIL